MEFFSGKAGKIHLKDKLKRIHFLGLYCAQMGKYEVPFNDAGTSERVHHEVHQSG